MKVAALAVTLALVSGIAHAEVRTFKMKTVEVDGAKFWLPSTIVVKKGDTVKIEAMSAVPGPNSTHGFEIKELNLHEVVDGNTKTIEFKAKKAGIFTIGCQLHPAHVASQLIVLE